MPSIRLRRVVVVALLAGGAATLTASLALADFSRSPESPYRYDTSRPRDPRPIVEEASEPWQSPGAESTLRFHVGPAVLLEPQGPGLMTALDIGRRAVGARVSAAWLRAESERGLSAYDLELWIDLRHRDDIHPIVGAGATLLQGGAVASDTNVGAGALRGALEYELPLEGADARLSLNVTALVPAIGTDRARPWAIAALTLGAGF